LFRNGYFLFLVATLAVSGVSCSDGTWNNPYTAANKLENTLYTSFSERPKHMDPARSYSENESNVISQIYEPPLQYHYLKRPYELIPLTATKIPSPEYLDNNGETLPQDTPVEKIAYSVYTITIKKDIKYQPHPAFALDNKGNMRYKNLDETALKGIYEISDFKHTGSRELTAYDYVYQIKRLAQPKLNSPIYGFMSAYIVGLSDYAKQLKLESDALAQKPGARSFLDLRRYDFAGAKVIDNYTYKIKIHGKYPQFLYWLAMGFFAPMPYEADYFYSQPGMEQRNITIDWYPVGTGPYMLTRNNPNLQMVLEKNPNFHQELYPSEGEPTDQDNGLLQDAGKPLPFIDKVIFSLEKEAIPGWNKFLQGYYDASGINAESFDQVINYSGAGEAMLSDAMMDNGIRLLTGIGTSTYYMGFNMKDEVVGSLSERSTKLRQAISIMIDYEEYISIFLNGRGVPAQGPIPPGIFGYVDGEFGINPIMYRWERGKPRRKSIEYAKQLLSEAGYPGGRNSQTGKPLIIHFDTAAGGPEAKARFDWFRKQFKKLNIQLDIRSSDYNRFQEKMLKGTAQFFQWGWNADYPDPENFLFLLYGPNAKVGKNGENAANYQNPKFDKLFEKIKNMENGPERLTLIEAMVDIVRSDAPWIWGLHPKQFSLYHKWYLNAKPNLMARNNTKYKRINTVMRNELRQKWNQPIIWPLYLLIFILLITAIPASMAYRKKIHARANR